MSIILVLAFVASKIISEYDNLDKRSAQQQRYSDIVYKIILKDLSTELVAASNKITENVEIREAFAARDRERLLKASSVIFSENNKTIKLMAYILPEGSHFLRVHDPLKFGDNLSKKRPVINEINKYKTPIFTFEPTKYGLSFVYLSPLYYDGVYIGFLHLGIDVSTLQSRLDEYLGAKSAILFDTTSMQTFGGSQNKARVGRFTLATYNDSAFEKLGVDFDLNTKVTTVDSKVFKLKTFDIFDHRGFAVAKMLFAQNITADIEELKNSVMKIVLFSLPLLVVIFIALRYSFGVLLQKISKNEEELKNRLYFDRTTSLPNRLAMKEDIDETQNPFLVLINIDSFKEINDLYGFAVGDYVLAELAKKIKHVLAKKYRLYKLSADEFAILGNEIENSIESDKIESMVQGFCDTPIMYNDNKIILSLTAGVSFGKSNIFEQADMALKQAKKKRVSLVVFTPDMEIVKEYEENIKWTSKLREAIEEDRIVPYFQPIVNTATGSIERYEALIRMHDNVGKPVSPYYFLEISKKAKLYGTLTKTMFAKTLKMFENSKYPVAFNISTEDILNESVKEFILARTEESMGKCKIIFEIVESDGIENYEEVSNFIAEVKKYGAQIAIDDFGTGYSNFEHLIKLKVDYIKIDGSLIKNMLKDKNSMVVVETIVDFASKLEIKTVAEFVESKEIAEAVNNMGIDYSQGYYFSEPLEYPVDKKSLP